MIPALGDWLMPLDPNLPPGMVVAVLPSGGQVVLARCLPTKAWGLFPKGGLVETVHSATDLKGPMTGLPI